MHTNRLNNNMPEVPMQIMRLVGGIILIMLLLSNTAYSQADQYPNIVWTEYAISETTGQNIWNKVKL